MIRFRPAATLALAALPALTLAFQQGSGQQGDPLDDPLDGPIVTGTGIEPDDLPPEGGPGDGPFPPGIGNRDAGTLDVFGRRTKLRANTLAERIKGGWQLTDFTIQGSDPRGRTAQGFLFIGDSFLSLELHAIWDDSEGNEEFAEEDMHTTFTAEYSIDAAGRLFCSTVIGSYIDDDTGELRWERTGFEREFLVRELKDELRLSFEGTNRMVFKARLPRLVGEVDLFGRKQIGSLGATDIYGRKVKAGAGERDVYGRVKNEDEGPALVDPEGNPFGDPPPPPPGGDQGGGR